MFRKLAIAVITAVVALLETVADAIVATLPPLTADSPRLRVVAPVRLCPRLHSAGPTGQVVFSSRPAPSDAGARSYR